MIKLYYANGKHQGEVYRIWRDYTSFVKETMDLVAKSAWESKVSQKATFLHYGYGVKLNEQGQLGFTNGILGSMNFWIDSFPDLVFYYDTELDIDDEGEINPDNPPPELVEEENRRKNFYEWLDRLAKVSGMQLFRTSNELWHTYATTEPTEEIKVWEPNVPLPQKVLEDYPTVASLLEAGNLINAEQYQENVAGLWAVEQILLGEPASKIMPQMREYASAVDKSVELRGKTKPELGVVFYAFLTAAFYEEVAKYLV